MANSIRILLVVLFGSALVGCASYIAEKDDQRCQSYGAKPGTDAYVNCRVQMGTQRAIIAAGS